ATGWSAGDQVGRPHEAAFTFAQPVNFDGAVKLSMLFERYYASSLGRFRISVTTDSRPAEATNHGMAIEAILAKPAKERTPEEREQLRRRFLEVAPELAAVHKELAQLRASLPTYVTTLVLKERPPSNPRPTHIHHRGEFLQTKDAVEAAVP